MAIATEVPKGPAARREKESIVERREKISRLLVVAKAARGGLVSKAPQLAESVCGCFFSRQTRPLPRWGACK